MKTAFQRIEFAVARALMALPKGMRLWLSGQSPVQLDGRTLDDQVQLLLRLRALRGSTDGLKGATPARARTKMHREAVGVAAGRPSMRSVRDVSVRGAEGDLPARHYVPTTVDAPAPLLVFYHGGGFVVGDLDTHDDACRILAHHARVHVLSVTYRLAPEHPFPAAVLDARAVLRWGRDHAAALGAEPSRVGVGGDSAGGNLAAVVSQLAARDGGPAPAFQLLIYPATDRSRSYPSMDLFATGFVLTAADMAWADENYYGADEATRSDPRLSPLLATDLGGLCPAVVATAGFDPLRDEGDAYARALASAGVAVDHIELAGFVHGFLHMTGISASALAATERIARATGDLAWRSPPPRAPHAVPQVSSSTSTT